MLALLYQMKDTETGRKLKPILKKMGALLKFVEPAEYDLPMGVLAGKLNLNPQASGEKPGASHEDEIDAPMLIMDGFSSADIDQLLKQMRTQKVPPISCKGILTTTNQFWSGRKLFQELKREHEAMHRQAR